MSYSGRAAGAKITFFAPRDEKPACRCLINDKELGS